MKINNITVKTPSSCNVDLIDIKTEYTNAKGDTLIDYIATKRKLTCDWKSLTTSEIQSLLNKVTNVFVPIEYIDPQLGVVTKTFKINSKSSPVYSYSLGLWDKLSIEFEEK